MYSFFLLVSVFLIFSVQADEVFVSPEIRTCITEPSFVSSIFDLSPAIARKQESLPVGSFACGSFVFEHDRNTNMCSKPVGVGPTICTSVWSDDRVVTATAFGTQCADVDSWITALREQKTRLGFCATVGWQMLKKNDSK